MTVEAHEAAGPRRKSAVDDGMYLFIIGDMSVFALIFGACLWQIRSDRAGFVADMSQLSVPIGFANTLILLWSSYCAAMAVHACRSDQVAWTGRYLRFCLISAAVFVVLKSVEYTGAISDGHGLVTSPFFSYYFVLTGLHLLHIVIGSTLLGISLRQTRSGALPSRAFLESGAAYWHMVDLLWLLIFSLLYVGGNV